MTDGSAASGGSPRGLYAAGRDVIDGLRADLAALLAAEGPGAQVHEAYVDVQSPSLDEVVADLPPGE